jgi:hypothetical protein
MPLIQFLTLNGFAVYVPDVRGNTGQGFAIMKAVEHDPGIGLVVRNSADDPVWEHLVDQGLRLFASTKGDASDD